MARKNSLVYTLPTEALAGSFTSPVTGIEYLDNCSYQIDCATSDAVGSFAIQASNDYDPGGPISGEGNPGTWVTLDLGSSTGTFVPFVNAADTNILINLNQVPFAATRLVYTSTTPGTGTVVITISNKSIGA